MNLQLSLKKKWFELTKAGIKTEDYREITPYWCSRLALLNGEKMTIERWRKYLINSGVKYMYYCSIKNSPINTITFLKIKTNTITLGYPKKNDSKRILKLENKGIEIRSGRPEWGAEENKLYFVIKHGVLKD
ncbi:hypothetical protein Phi39:1_gp01 [Cellulophaga phage phi39:1]|uniref:hypothetical protein n=1 Tax=Cellulophaga phage phi39:1 TaxID=1327993 RepID=UPI000351EA5F|nr:hypothetical protein Phi39:1_gp01 [Cellulophaga phage phi39:1]AGO49116.1 hypothetical protein Phi39:1_gp01 [Cellulophaga phage phi39:1]